MIILPSDENMIHDIPMGLLSCGPCTPPNEGVELAIAGLKDAGITTVVSMLTDADQVMLGITGEADACQKHGLAFLRLPVPDQSPPPDTTVATAFFKDLARRYARGEHLYIHCMHGVGRAPSAVAAVLVLMGAEDVRPSAKEAVLA